MSISIYYLRKFGLSSSLATSLATDEVQLLDLFLEKNSKLSKLYTKQKIEKLKKILQDALLSISKSTNIFDNTFILESCGAKIGTGKIYDKSSSISEFKTLLEIVDWKNEGLLVASKKLKKQIDEYNQILTLESNQKEISKWNHYIYFLQNTYINDNQIEEKGLDRKIIKDLLIEGYLEMGKSEMDIMISIDNVIFPEKLLGLFMLDKNYYIENKRDKQQHNENLITLDDYLSTDFSRKEVFILRLEGKSLKEVGDVCGLTRERVRQIVNRILQKMPKIYEVEQHHEVFSKYMISKDIFINVFYPDGRVYELLSLIHKKGNQDVLKYILEGDFDEKSKQYIIGTLGRTVEKDNNKKSPREYIICEILKRNKNLQKYFSLEDIYYLYTEESKGYSKLHISSLRGLDSLLDRCSNVIFSFREGYRFHDVSYTNEINDNLSKIMRFIPDGAYSMNWIFKNNLMLMRELDILNGSELHYFFKKYANNLDNINLGRNPEFVKGELTKKEYVLSQLKIFNGKSIDVFVTYMNKNFGLNSDSLASYISAQFPENIVNRTIFFQKVNDKEQLAILNNILTEELYEKKEFYIMISHYFSENEINQELIFDLGYAEKGGVVVKINYKSAREALIKYILSNKIFRIDDKLLLKTNEYHNTIQKLENELKILKISSDSYINVNYLEERGFNKSRFVKFISSVNNFTEEGEYFTIVSLINRGFNDNLLADGFELISLDRLISISDEVKAVSVGFPNIYCRCKDKKSLNDFLIDELFKWGSANIDDFTDDINNKYGLNLDEYNVKVRIVEEGAYYSDILNKAYIMKEDYLNEVYGE